MKKSIVIILTVLATLISVNAATPGAAPKDKVVKGIAKCAKCSLKETATCQSVIEVKKGNKKKTYYLTDNDVSKGFHKNICTESKHVKATLSLTEENGKQAYAAKKIELAN